MITWHARVYNLRKYRPATAYRIKPVSPEHAGALGHDGHASNRPDTQGPVRSGGRRQDPQLAVAKGAALFALMKKVRISMASAARPPLRRAIFQR